MTKNLHDEILEMPDEEWKVDYFVYKLGPAIKPTKVRWNKRSINPWGIFG